MAYTLGNKCAKNLCKRIVLLQLIIENVVTCFFWNTVYIQLSLWTPWIFSWGQIYAKNCYIVTLVRLSLVTIKGYLLACLLA